ncbi:acetyl-CoA acetyltransferase [Novosphingobium sp. Gsoil 351]|uniref:acetyl-CoA acetyltransferase n=1 Tax=Novosphingobium sp. Gsoil 351 TaxID=2675225 RepID=UPI0012B48351|nr:acetyl-CoA acetyltransferase [Novosphingobium sp. Gsoil 351]QGN53945.1 acetyl-CoA acetyltransferase [Novosphingobium sp. Gsoil 351]
MSDPERTPVIIAVGQVNDRPADPAQGLDPLGLMVAALRACEADAGTALLSDLDSLAVVDQISFREMNPLCGRLAAALGAAPATLEQSDKPHGDTPIRMLNDAANRIGAGEARLCAVAGAEALRTAAQRAAQAAPGTDASYALRRPAKLHREPDYAQAHGLVAPVDVYPLYENATRAAWGQSLAEGQAESGAIWSRMSEVAAGEEGAWIRKPVDAEAILTADAGNRPIAFPYTKLTVANSSVNQGAGFVVASLAEARRRAIAEERLVFVGMGAAAKEPASILARDGFTGSVSMETSIRRTLELNATTGADFAFAELYSCFPCVPKMARRLLDWPLDRPATVFGGLTFGGGPIGNYMSHAVVAMVGKLRGAGGNGFLFANGGFATDNHCIVLSREPLAAAKFPQDYDYQAEADALRGAVPVLDEAYAGPATVESYTVFYARDGQPRGGVVVARTPAGARTLAHVDVADAGMVAFLTDGRSEPVGVSGRIEPRGESGRFWVHG